MIPAGMTATASDASFLVTVARLNAALETRGIVPMARIDHAALAQAAGLELPPTLLILFGNPALGTPLMGSAPSIAIDLPLKLLIWQAQQGVQVAFTDPAWLAERHALARTMPQLAQMAANLRELSALASGAPRPCCA